MNNIIKRKSQTQVFFYMLAVIALGAVILFGYKAINSLLKQGCEAEKAQFKADIEDILENYNHYGSVHIETIKAPCNARKVCFVSSEAIGKQNALPNRAMALIKSNAEAGVKANIYIIGKTAETIDVIGFSDYVFVDKNYTCIPNTAGVFRILFQGLGAFTNVSRASG